MLDPDAGAGLLHRLTSYTPDREWDVPADDPRLRHDLEPNDVATVPPWLKDYPVESGDLPVVELPRDLPDPGVSAASVLAGVPAASQPLDAAQLGRVLFLGAGVVRYLDRGERRIIFRASGSAGARFPLEVYACTVGVEGVPDGVHWYDGVRHALVQVGPAPAGDATTLVVTGVPWRTAWRYAERGFRHLYWDAGTLLSQLEAAVASVGWDPRLRTLFPDASVRELVGADGVHELPLALLTFGSGDPAVRPRGPATRGELPEVEFPLYTSAQAAGEADVLGDAWPVGETVAAPPGSPLHGRPIPDWPSPDRPALDAPTLDDVVRRRGSQRRMVRGASVPRELLDWPMTVAMRGIDVSHWIVAHSVDGLEPGIYRWPDVATPLARGDLRDELERICLGQSLGAEAAYVAISAMDPGLLDDRSYRDAQLASGLVEGRLHLAAYALGISASGMTFLDSEVPALLGEDDDLVVLLFTCVGVPEYRGRSGGTPGAPVTFKPVMPRMVDQ